MKKENKKLLVYTGANFTIKYSEDLKPEFRNQIIDGPLCIRPPCEIPKTFPVTIFYNATTPDTWFFVLNRYSDLGECKGDCALDDTISESDGIKAIKFFARIVNSNPSSTYTILHSEFGKPYGSILVNDVKAYRYYGYQPVTDCYAITTFIPGKPGKVIDTYGDVRMKRFAWLIIGFSCNAQKDSGISELTTYSNSFHSFQQN